MRLPNDKKPSVLHVYKDYWPPIVGGMEKCIHWMCDETRDEYHVRVLVASRSRRLEDEIIDGVRVVRVPSYGRALSSPLAPGFVSWMRRLDSDILHFHMPNPVGELACLLARPARSRIVATYQSDIVRQRLTGAIYGPMQQAFLRQAHTIMASSKRYMESSPTLAAHRDRCRVVPLGIPLDRYDETPASRAFGESLRGRFPDRLFVVFLGVLRYYKGLHFLIRALAGLPERVCLLVGGQGPERPRLERAAREAGVSGRVHFLGELSHPQAVGLLRAGDIFCLPSHLRAEAFGLCQVEAMACGLPLVSADLPTGVPEVNRDNESGLTVPPGDAEALRAALARLAEDEALRRRLGDGARRRAEAHYTAPRMARDVKAVYQAALAGRIPARNG